MKIYSNETIEALAKFQAEIDKLPGTRVHDELILDDPADAVQITKALRYAFGDAAPVWVDGQYVEVKPCKTL